jgi:hypothetical protein
LEEPGKKGCKEILRVPRIMREKEELVYLALGWLIREDKISFYKKEEKLFIFLNIEEHEIFKKFQNQFG